MQCAIFVFSFFWSVFFSTWSRNFEEGVVIFIPENVDEALYVTKHKPVFVYYQLL